MNAFFLASILFLVAAVAGVLVLFVILRAAAMQADAYACPDKLEKAEPAGSNDDPADFCAEEGAPRPATDVDWLDWREGRLS